ncbi:hypothetical protein ACFY12_25200 [Streptomyces sp. NPDC001339]|uniref:hypothetical protein n=1 Tax=Streptomyces sp. NPDC001339 TaxID=3364563 RepID=UPI0036CB821B
MGLMDPQLAQLAQTAGTTVVALMATEAWRSTRDGVVTLWRRVFPARADEVEAALDDTRADIVLAREQADADAEEALAAEWNGRLRRLLAAQPEVAQELDQLLREAHGRLSAGEQSLIGTVRQSAHATGHGRIYQAGRDQHITER